MTHGRTLRLAAALTALLGACATTAQALDQPLDGSRLFLGRSAAGEELLLFVAEDDDVLFPVPGGPDDPVSGDPGGATVELFSRNDPAVATLLLPRGKGRPGWRRREEKGAYYKFSNCDAPAGISPVRMAFVREGKGLLVIGRTTGLALTGAQGAVGIRITMGALRSCAYFDARTIRHDVAGRFMARNSRALLLRDCSDESLRGGVATTPTTSTTSSTSTSTTTSSTTSSTSTSTSSSTSTSTSSSTSTTSTSSTTTTLAGTTYGNATEFPAASAHSPGYLLGGRLTVPQPSVLTHLGVIAKAGGPQVRMGLYTNGSGGPAQLVATAPPAALTVGAVEIPVPPTALAAGTYWVMAVYDTTASVGLDESDPTALVTYMARPFEFPLPNPMPPLANYTGQRFNYYIRVQ
jgi:hypothetical protein